MNRYVAGLCFALVAALSLLAACGDGRFDDEGCGADTDCRGERICHLNRCVFPEEARDDGTGGDTGEDAYDPAVLTGSYAMDVSGTMELEGQGGRQDLNGVRVSVAISTGTNADLHLDIEDFPCTIEAEMTGEDSFAYAEQECVLDGASRGIVSGSGGLDADGFLEFDLLMESEIDQGGQPMSYVLDVSFVEVR